MSGPSRHRPKFGIFLPAHDVAAAVATAKRAEELGFWSVSLNDHFVAQTGPVGTPQVECLVTLSVVAALTSTIRLAPSVLAAAYRSPALLAKMTATLDQASGGRFVLGLGAGWHRDEYAAHGYPFPSTAERFEHLEETISVVKAMWTQDDPCFTGRHVAIAHAASQPRPVQRPHPPLMLGGSSDGLLAIGAHHADIVNLIPPTANGKDFIKDRAATARFTPARLRQRIDVLRRLTEEAGRDPDDVELGGLVLVNVSDDVDDPAFARLARRMGFASVDEARTSPVALLGTPAQVMDELARRAEDGVTYSILVPTSPDAMERFAAEVLPAFPA